MIEPCRCAEPNTACTRAGVPMTYSFWRLCAGVDGCSVRASEQCRAEWDRRQGIIQVPSKKQELGDQVEAALKLLRITSEKVEKWLGRPCNCEARKQKLNQLSRWAKRILARKSAKS